MTACRSPSATPAGPDAAGLGDLAGAGDVVDDGELLAGGRHGVEPGDLDRRRRAGLGDRAALVVEQGADAAEAVAADDHVADLEGAVLDQHGGDDAPALGDRRLQAGPGGRPRGVGLQLVPSSATIPSVSSRSAMPLAGQGRGLDDRRVAAVFLGDQALLRELAVDLVEVDVGQVDLVQGDDDRHVGRLGVGDRLLGLGHHAVVGRDDQDDDVGDVGPPGPHGGERLVARRVDEGDLLARRARPGRRRCAG